MPKHICTWVVASVSGREVKETCKCGKSRVSQLTKAEWQAERQKLKELLHPKPEDNVHRVWQEFAKKFMSLSPDIPPKWKWTGYEFVYFIYPA